MDQRVMDIFMRELDNQGDAVKVAWEQYRDAITALQEERPQNVRQNVARVFLAVQAILASGALVSKLLWMSQPQRPQGCTCPPDPAAVERNDRAKERCKALRNALNIKGGILQSRKVRNSFEHFDDYLDSYFAHDPGRMVADRFIASLDPLQGSVLFMRHLDPDSNIISILGESVPLAEIRDAVTDVADRAAQWLDEYAVL